MLKDKKPLQKIYQIIMLLLAIVCIASLLSIVIGLTKSGGTDPSNPDNIKVSDRTDKYQIPNNPTDYQREIYESLARVTNSIKDINTEDLSELAKEVTRSFIADYFTWSNKRGSYDVGGLDYVFGPTHSNFSWSAREYYYNDLDILMKDYGVENLPTVSNINIQSVEHMTDKYKWKTTVHDWTTNEDYEQVEEYDAYLVKADWQYDLKEGSTYDPSNLPNDGNFMLVVRDGRLKVGYYHEFWVRGLAEE